MRIGVQLVSAVDGYQVWTLTVERGVDDIFKLQTDAALRRAMDCFRQAIDRDAGYALAYPGLADPCTLASTGYYGEIPRVAPRVVGPPG